MKEIELIIEHSKHFRIRFGEIKYIIIHCSTTPPFEQVKQLDKLGVSAHFIIGRGGEIIENLSVDNVAYHAGISSWNKSLPRILPVLVAPAMKSAAIDVGSSSRESSSVMMTISE